MFWAPTASPALVIATIALPRQGGGFVVAGHPPHPAILSVDAARVHMSSMERTTVATVVLHYGSLADTRDCLHSLLCGVDGSVAVIVVVNDGSSEAARYLRAEFPSVEVLETSGNLGFAAGNNLGIRRALERQAEQVVLLNNDTVVDPGFLEPLMAVFPAFPDAGMATGPVLLASPPHSIWSAGGTLGGWTALTRHSFEGRPRSDLPDTILETEYANGCFVMISRRCLEHVGLMDERYFLYYEDTDWCARVRKAGLKIYYTPGPAVLHKVSAGTQGRKALFRYYCDRNSWHYARRNLPWYALPVYGSAFFARIGYRVATAARRRDRDGMRFAWRALRDGLAGIMGPCREP